MKLYDEQKYSIYELQKKLGLSKDALYKYARGENNIENMPIKLVIDIAYIEKIEVNELYDKMKKYLKKKGK